jgi:hypothetical protein
MSAGLLTIAHGSHRYIRMAEALALSYRRWKPTRPICVVTDDANAKRLGAYFDVVRILDESSGAKGTSQRFYVDHYTPFDETLVVDSDCLFYRDPERTWNAYAVGDFVVKGWRYLRADDRHANVGDLRTLLQQTGVSRMGSFNSGLFYFRRNASTARLFDTVRSLFARRDELALRPFKNSPVAHEPLLAIGMELCGIEFLPWDAATGQETWIDMGDMRAVNVLRGESRVVKHGKTVEPAVIHYNVGGQFSLAYLRDIFRLSYEGQPLAEMRARIAASCLRGWYVAEKRRRTIGRRDPRRPAMPAVPPGVGRAIA